MFIVRLSEPFYASVSHVFHKCCVVCLYNVYVIYWCLCRLLFV